MQDDDDDVLLCTICLEPTREPAQCQCRGTSGHVHSACLWRWRDQFPEDDQRRWLCMQCGEPLDPPTDEETGDGCGDSSAEVALVGQPVQPPFQPHVCIFLVSWACVSLSLMIVSDIIAARECLLPGRCVNSAAAAVSAATVAAVAVGGMVARGVRVQSVLGELMALAAIALALLVPDEISVIPVAMWSAGWALLGAMI